MASEAHIRDQSDYLTAGNLSDLTLHFGDKTWHIHKAIACSHSQWFRNAVTGGFEETSSGVVTLGDEPEFSDAVDCMVSYFYRAQYSAASYEVSASLLHARVAIIADKYGCASLYELAKGLLAGCIETAKMDDWVAIAALVYEYTTSDVSSHMKLRQLVVTAAARPPTAAKSFFSHEEVERLLRSNADLATDLLLFRVRELTLKDRGEHIFTCDHCHFVHAGSQSCPQVVMDRCSYINECPHCGNRAGAVTKKYTCKVDVRRSEPCPSCNGVFSKQKHLRDSILDAEPAPPPPPPEIVSWE